MWAKDISFAYNSLMLLKKALSAAVVVLRFLYDHWGRPKSLDISARILTSFISLVLVDMIDGLAREETRLKSQRARGGVFTKFWGWVSG